jgi:glycosyltransferase involved in cell wall biosynthesis
MTVSGADGGVEVCDRQIALHTARAGRKAVIVATGEDFFTGRLEGRTDVPVLHALRRCDRWLDAGNFLAAWRFFAALRPRAVLFDHVTIPSFSSMMLAARAAGVRRVVSSIYLHETERRPAEFKRYFGGLIGGVGLWWYRRREKLRWCFAANDAVLFATRDHRERFARDFELPPRRWRVVPHLGVDVERFKRDDEARRRLREAWEIGEGELCLLFVGRLSIEKGVDVLLRALASIDRLDELGLRLVIAGDGPQRGRLETLTDELHLRERTRFLGRIDDVPGAQSAADIVAMPSRDECFGLALVEAMAVENPVVATRVGGMREILTDGVDGLAIESEDVVALAEAIVRLAGDAALRARLGAQARRTAEDRYAKPRVLERIDEVLGLGGEAWGGDR